MLNIVDKGEDMSMEKDVIRYERIKELREAHGYTLRHVAQRIGVTESTIQRHENGKGIRNIPFTAIVGYSRLYHVNPAYLMGWTDDPRTQEQVEKEAQYYSDPEILRIIEAREKDERYKELFDAILNLSPESVELITKLIKKLRD